MAGVSVLAIEVGALVLPAAVLLAVAWYVASRPDRAAKPLAGALLSVAGYGVFAAIATLQHAPGPVPDAVDLMQYFLALFVFAFFWGWFVLTYTGRRDLVGRWRLVLGFLPVLVGATTLLGWLSAGRAEIDFAGGFQTFVTFTIPMLVSYGSVFASAGLLVYSLATNISANRIQSGLFAASAVAFVIVPGALGLPFSLWIVATLLSVSVLTAPVSSVPVAESIGRKIVVSQTENGVFVLDERERIVDVNPGAEAMFGVDQADILGLDFAAFLASHTESTPPDSLSDLEPITVRLDGRRYYDPTVSTISLPDEPVVGYTVVVHDVSTNREHRERLQVLNRVLRHNLRNDLSVVILYAELIADGIEDPAAAGEIKAAALELVEMGDTVRSIERLVDGDLDPTNTSDACEVVRAVATSYTESHPEATIEVTASGSVAVAADRDLLELALSNLVENAIVHTPEADPTVSISVEAPDDSRRRARIVVRDDGPGIPSHEIATVESGSESPLQHGSGLGLWAVKWVVDRFGGTIRYETPPEGGTEVELLVPAAT